jgi:hypothetical protein
VGPFVVGELVGLSDGFRVGGCEIGTFEHSAKDFHDIAPQHISTVL